MSPTVQFLDRRRRACVRLVHVPAAFLLLFLALTGCSRFRHKQQNDIVYVLPKQTFLRDRVAAVSNRVAIVTNGQRLEVLEHGRRFVKVKTDKGEIGWIEEHAVVDPAVVTGFEDLQKAHEHDPVIATAVLRDDGYMHLKPGRDTDRFYLLAENDKLQLLLRASVPKALALQAPAPSLARSKTSKNAGPSGKTNGGQEVKNASTPVSKPTSPALAPAPAKPTDSQLASIPGALTAPPGEPVPMEDWWLVRDSAGKVGWLMSRRMDVDVPDEIAGYAEGQKIVGAYVLDKRDDPDSKFSDKLAPEYVTVLNPYKDGLPYDFNQVRVFTWNLRKHRYETAYRQRNLQGYLPVTVERQTLDKAGPVPTFQFKNGIGDAVGVDPETGATKPAQTETLTYRLDGSIVRKVEPAAPAVAKLTAASAAPASEGSAANKKASKKHKKHPAHAKHHSHQS